MSEEKEVNQEEETEEENDEIENNEEEKTETKSEESEEESLTDYVDLEEFKKEFAERIRKEEKDKLYPQIKETKNQAKKLEQEKQELEQKLKDYEDQNLSAEEKNAKKYDELIEYNQKLEKQLQETADKAAKEIYNIKLDGAKKEVLAKYGEDIIPEMVSGETVEEIYENAEKSHNKYLEIRKKEEERQKKQRQREKTGSNINPSDSEKIEKTDLDEISNADPKNWDEIKQKLLQDVSGIT